MAQGIVEGATRIFPPAAHLGRRPGQPGARIKGEPFYNPGMAFNRDLSVLLVEAASGEAGRPIDVADALAGTGARSLRMAHETTADVAVHHNDADPKATRAARRGQRANRVPAARLRVGQGDAHAFLASRRFDVVDLDPCGSPAPFLDAAVRATRDGGLLCATATDTAALCGVYPEVCARRYAAHHGLHASVFRAEVGLRILAGAVVRAAARFDRAAIPVLSVARGHWMRVVARITGGAGQADRATQALRDAAADGHGLGRIGPRAAGGAWAGPLWSGPLHDAALVAAMRDAAAGKRLARGPDVARLLALLAQEADAPPFWVVPDLLHKALGPPPRRDVLMARLRDAGFRAARTHLDAQGIRTDATLGDLKAAWKP